MKAISIYLFAFFFTLSACIDVAPEKEKSQEEDEIIRILNDRFPLMKAVKAGKTEELKRLLKIEAFKKNVNQQDEEGNTALLFAVEYSFADMLSLLIEAGADPSLSDFKKRTPLMNATYKGRANIVTQLLQIDVVKKNINAQDTIGNTAFVFAAKKGHDNIMDLLLMEGADPILSNFKERTPLMEAAIKGQLSSVTKLLQIKAVTDTINAEDKYGNTALSLAQERGNKQIISLLREAGAILKPLHQRAYLKIKKAFRKVFLLQGTNKESLSRKTATQPEAK